MEKRKPSIIEALNSEAFFRPVFGDLATWKNWHTFLKALYGLPMTTEEIELSRTCTQREQPNEKGYREAYAIVGRRGGKSRIASLIAVYEALFGGWSEHLAAGETASIFIIATDKNQSQIVLNYIKGLLALFPDLTERELREEILLKNHINIVVKPCSFRASRGFSTAVVIADELAFWRDENSANPAEEVINSILPGLLPNGLLLGISTPYARFGYLYDMHKGYFGKDSDILVWQAGTRLMNPTYSETNMNRLIKRDQVVFSAEFEARFREDLESYMPEQLIKSAMVHSTSIPPEPGKRYVAFVDPSGGRSDSMTLAIGHKESERIIVDYIEERRSPFDPGIVAKDFSQVIKSYQAKECRGDRYGGVWVTSAFQKNGVTLRLSEMDKNELYLNFQPLVSMGRVSLPRNDRLLLQFKMLERRTRSGGRDLIDHPSGLHDDLANAVAGCCVMAAQEKLMTLQEAEKFLPQKAQRAVWWETEVERRRRQRLQDEANLEEIFRRDIGGSKIVRNKPS
jgi:hypothetical protein